MTKDEQTLAELAMRIWQGDPLAPAEAQACAFRTSMLNINGDTLVGTGLSGIQTGLTLGTDPITAAVTLCMARHGTNWIHLYPRLLERVNEQWRAALRARQQQKQQKQQLRLEGP